MSSKKGVSMKPELRSEKKEMPWFQRAVWIGISIIAASVCLNVHAQDFSYGGLFVEPMVTFEVSHAKLNWPITGSSSGSVRGLGIGARVGAHFGDTLWIALDARYGRPNFDNTATSSVVSADKYDFAPTVGVQMPVWGLRGWAGYVMAGSLDPASAKGFDVKFDGGAGYRIGIGMRVMMVSVNLEYQDLKYDHFTLQALGPVQTNGSFSGTTLDNQSWVLSASVPVAL
jgi:hypothetical protein